MDVVFSGKVAARVASSVPVSSGSNPPKLKATPPSSSLNSSAVPVSCHSSPPYRNLSALSLLYEACGRIVNPVNGAVRLLWMRNWSICQVAVETVLRGGSLRPIPEPLTCYGGFGGFPSTISNEASGISTEMMNDSGDRSIYHHSRFSGSRSRSVASPPKRRRLGSEQQRPSPELDLSLIPFPIRMTPFKEETRRPETPSMYSEESIMTVPFLDNGERYMA
ncbi:unnamed protein product [Eruca vesicaria subsp. sativa]|uniref:LOB domain-containing protein n=1 Tax=Eruca vesicaria subsp. sativa TaxID=29727 RepID=A0ABC8JLY3_ERUVS|nr:unnamed protein product [Eruca vesicaria subsp. sativa]